MLLPKPIDENAEEIDPREELVRRLLEYQKYKEASLYLGDNHGKGYLSFYKVPDVIEPPERTFDTVNLTLANLLSAFHSAFARAERKLPPSKAPFEQIVSREKVSIRMMVANVWSRLKFGIKTKFNDIFKGCKSRGEVVATFLAVLELVKLKKLNVDYAKDEKSFMLDKLEDTEIDNIDFDEETQPM